MVLILCVVTLGSIAWKATLREPYQDRSIGIYIISLPHRQDRLRRCMRRNSQWMTANARVVSAVDGRRLRPQHGTRLTPGERGCFMSHVKALRMIAEGSEDFGLVLEDDAILHDAWRDSLHRELAAANDVTVLGCNWFPKKKKYAGISRGHDMTFDLYGAHAIVYSRDGAKRVLAEASTWDEAVPYDIWLSHTSPHITKRVMWPSLASVENIGDTDTQGIRVISGGK